MTDTLPGLDLILLSGGSGSRFGSDVPKTFISVNGRTLIMYPLLAFASMPFVERIILVVSRQCPLDMIESEPVMSRVTVVYGGVTRTESVGSGLRSLSESRHADYVAVHDGARAFVPSDVVQSVLAAAAVYGIAAPGVPVTDTVKRISDDGIVTEHLRRDELTAIQTPQIFRYDILSKLYSHNCAGTTDDTELASLYGLPAKIVPGSRDLFKITYPEDIVFAEQTARRYMR